MSDAINAIFQFIESHLGLQPAGVASLALVLVLLLVVLALYLYSRLRGTRHIIASLGEHLGYDPPYGDGAEIFDQEFRKEIVEKGREKKIEQLEQHISEMETETRSKDASLTSLRQHSKELETQLQQVLARSEKLAADSAGHMQTHQTAVEEWEKRLNHMETESNANHTALEQRAKDLEDQLHLVSHRNDELTAQAGEHANAYRASVGQLEQRLNEMEAESNATLDAHQEHAKSLEEQLRQATLRGDQISAQAAEQAQLHLAAIDQYEQRIRETEAGSAASLAALHQRTQDLEDQVQQATLRHDQVLEHAGQQSQDLRATIAQLEQRVREMEAESNSNLNALQLRAKDLESQLRQSYLRHEQVATEANEQARAHHSAVAQLEQRISEMEAEHSTNLASLQQHAANLEEQLHQANNPPAPEPQSVANTSNPTATAESLLHHADWIIARTVGPILSHGLVAAEAYAAAALASDPQNLDAPQMLAELAKIRRAYPEGLPPVTEAVTTFDERAASFFAADPAGAAAATESEARRRARAGMNRSALLATNLALELHQQTHSEDSPSDQSLLELKETLLARLGGNSDTTNTVPSIASS